MSVSLIDGHIDDDALGMTIESVIENLEKVRCHTTSEWDKFIIDDVCAFMKRQKAEIERLQSPCEMQIEVSKKLENQIKAEAFKEFAERLKEHKHECGCNYRKKPVYAVTEEKIDNLVKEMVGD